MCNDTTIKELLAPYQEQKLDKPEHGLVENHLASCEDCRLELSILSMMAAEPVPDPGDAFWAAIPGRVYRAFQVQRPAKKDFGIAWFLDRVTLPRWALVSAATATVLMLSWFLIKPVPEMVPSQGYEFADEIMPADPVHVAELSGDELITLDTWAGTALVSIAKETEQAIGSVQDADIYEDVAELDAGEVEQLLKMIDQRTKEVSS
jgi:hypothetical protein